MRRRDFIIAGAAGLAAGPVWARQGRSIEVPIRLENGRVLVDVTLNGEGPVPFVIDTGGSVSGMKGVWAERLGLRPARYVTLNSKRFPLYEVGEVGFGGVIRQQGVALFGLDEGTVLDVQGLLAAGTVTAMDASLEYERGVWSVYPDGMPPLDGYERLPSEMKASAEGASMIPHADVAVNGRVMRALWDTGAPRPLTVHYEVARGLGLLHPSIPYAPIGFAGIQGVNPDTGRMVRVERITIGSNDYSNMLLAIYPPSIPRRYHALLGLPIMRTLDTAFDRSSRTFSVRRNGLAPDMAPKYPLSGIWLNDRRGQARVDAVGLNSPAAEAGVQVGDLLEGASLREGVALLDGSVGQSKELKLNRDGQKLTVRFDLKAYL